MHVITPPVAPPVVAVNSVTRKLVVVKPAALEIKTSGDVGPLMRHPLT